MKLILSMENSDNARAMTNYMHTAIAAVVLRSPLQSVGFVLDGQNTVAKWELVEDAAADPLADPSNRETIKAALILFRTEFENAEDADIYERFPDLFPGFHGKCAQPLGTDDIDALIAALPALEPTPHEANPTPPAELPQQRPEFIAMQVDGCPQCGSYDYTLTEEDHAEIIRCDGCDHTERKYKADEDIHEGQPPYDEDKEPGQCEHETVIWEPVEMEYEADGTALVWQEGKCQTCGELVQMDYNHEQPKTVAT